MEEQTLISWDLKKDPGQLFRTSSRDELVQQFSGVVSVLKIQVYGCVAYIGPHYPSSASGVWSTLTVSPNGTNENSLK